MKLEYAPPPADLAEYISAFYLFEADLDHLDDIERADFAQVRVILDGEATAFRPDGSEVPYPPVSVLGPSMKASRIVARGPKLRLFGFGLLPAGWAMAISRPADSCVDQLFPVADLLGREMTALPGILASHSGIDQMVAHVADRCRALYVNADAAPLWFVRAVDEWLEADLVPDMAKLESSTGLGRRQIDRLMRNYYGAPAKLLIQKYRALRAASAIANGSGEWQGFIDTAFYDQPHFIRDIKRFTGMTPGAIRSAKSPLSSLVFGRSKLAGDLRPLVADT